MRKKRMVNFYKDGNLVDTLYFKITNRFTVMQSNDMAKVRQHSESIGADQVKFETVSAH